MDNRFSPSLSLSLVLHSIQVYFFPAFLSNAWYLSCFELVAAGFLPTIFFFGSRCFFGHLWCVWSFVLHTDSPPQKQSLNFSRKNSKVRNLLRKCFLKSVHFGWLRLSPRFSRRRNRICVQMTHEEYAFGSRSIIISAIFYGFVSGIFIKWTIRVCWSMGCL